jgi:hypothetical protein
MADAVRSNRVNTPEEFADAVKHRSSLTQLAARHPRRKVVIARRLPRAELESGWHHGSR